MTDAALLKRQKLEIEELRSKLQVRLKSHILTLELKNNLTLLNFVQGSRAEVLEQEILKLRNDMLKVHYLLISEPGLSSCITNY